MSSTFLWENFFRGGKQDDLITLLRRVPIFESLTSRELKLVENILHRRVYAEGEPVFREGEKGSAMYIIEKGEVRLRSGETAREVGDLHDGDFFGEMALFSEQPRPATAVAHTDTRLFGFAQADLLGLLETNPRLGIKVVMKLARVIAERLRRASIENRRLRDQLESAGKS